MEKCSRLGEFGCGKEIRENEKYSYMFKGEQFEISPQFSLGLSFCSECNQKTIDRLLELNPSFLEIILFEDHKIRIDWKKYWKNYKNNFPRMDYNDESINRYENFCFLLICLGIYSRKKTNTWRFENTSCCVHDYLGLIYFVESRDAVDYLLYRILDHPLNLKMGTGIELVSSVITEEYLNSYLEEMRKNKD